MLPASAFTFVLPSLTHGRVHTYAHGHFEAQLGRVPRSVCCSHPPPVPSDHMGRALRSEIQLRASKQPDEVLEAMFREAEVEEVGFVVASQVAADS